MKFLQEWKIKFIRDSRTIEIVLDATKVDRRNVIHFCIWEYSGKEFNRFSPKALGWLQIHVVRGLFVGIDTLNNFSERGSLIGVIFGEIEKWKSYRQGTGT